MSSTSLAMPILQMFVGTFTVLFNILTLAIFSRTRTVKATTVYLISYLAVSDICLGVSNIIRSSMMLAGNLSWSFCTLLLDVLLTSAGGSLIAILMMQLEVFLSISYAGRYNSLFTKGRVLLIIVGSIIFWTGIGVVGFTTRNSAPVENVASLCFPHSAFDPDFLIGLCSVYIAFFVAILIIQLLILRFFHAKRARVVEQMRRPTIFSLSGATEGGSVGTIARRTQWMKRKLNLSKLLAVVLIMFALCWYPYIFAALIHGACRKGCGITYSTLSNLGSLILFHGILNIFVYIFKCQEFRTTLKKSVCCVCQRKGRIAELSRSNTINRIGSDVE